MRPLMVAAIVAAVLFLIGHIRVGGRAEYSARGFFAWLRLGPLYIQVFPGKGKKKPKKANQKKEKPQKPKEESPREPVLQKVGGAVDYAMALLPVALDAAAQFGRKLQIDVLRLELTAGAEDPADAALRYGQAVAALGALWGPLTRAFQVKDGQARALVDFGAAGMTVYGTAVLSLKLEQLLRLALWFGLRALWAFLGVRKEHKREKQEQFSVKT